MMSSVCAFLWTKKYLTPKVSSPLQKRKLLTSLKQQCVWVRGCSSLFFSFHLSLSLSCAHTHTHTHTQISKILRGHFIQTSSSKCRLLAFHERTSEGKMSLSQTQDIGTGTSFQSDHREKQMLYIPIQCDHCLFPWPSTRSALSVLGINQSIPYR